MVFLKIAMFHRSNSAECHGQSALGTTDGAEWWCALRVSAFHNPHTSLKWFANNWVLRTNYHRVFSRVKKGRRQEREGVRRGQSVQQSVSASSRVLLHSGSLCSIIVPCAADDHFPLNWNGWGYGTRAGTSGNWRLAALAFFREQDRYYIHHESRSRFDGSSPCSFRFPPRRVTLSVFRKAGPFFFRFFSVNTWQVQHQHDFLPCFHPCCRLRKAVHAEPSVPSPVRVINWFFTSWWTGKLLVRQQVSFHSSLHHRDLRGDCHTGKGRKSQEEEEASSVHHTLRFRLAVGN